MSTQSRKSERAATQNPAETLESPSPREACLSVRLWSAHTDSGQAQSLWDNNSPAACLTLDLIATSGGLPTARHDEVLIAAFPTFQSAAMTARRLQWAVQGYAESEEPKATSLALLIHSPDEGTGNTIAEDTFHSLGQAASGAVLLTEKASQPFDRLPGFPLQVAAGDGLWELAWSGSDGHFSRSEDEEFLARIAAENGVQEQLPEPPAPKPAPEPVFAEEPRTGSYRTGSHRTGTFSTGSYRQPSLDEPRKSSKMWIGGVALAAVVIAGVAFHLFSGKSNSAPAADQNAAQSAALTQPQTENGSAAGGSAPVASAPVQPKHQAENAPAAKQSKNAAKQEAQQAQEKPPEKERPAPKPEPPAPKPSRDSRCDLDPSQYSGQVDQAWKNLGRGKYAAAQRQFVAVLACDPGNGRAREGLERARNAAVAEGGSAN